MKRLKTDKKYRYDQKKYKETEIEIYLSIEKYMDVYERTETDR